MRVLIALLMLLSTTWSSAAAARIVHPAPCAHFDEENSRARAHARLDAGNLVYARARYLDPSTGRFLSLDPSAGSLSDPFSTQGFTYVGGMPTRSTDPDGREACPGQNTLSTHCIAITESGELVQLAPAGQAPARVTTEMLLEQGASTAGRSVAQRFLAFFGVGVVGAAATTPAVLNPELSPEQRARREALNKDLEDAFAGRAPKAAAPAASLDGSDDDLEYQRSQVRRQLEGAGLGARAGLESKLRDIEAELDKRGSAQKSGPRKTLPHAVAAQRRAIIRDLKTFIEDDPESPLARLREIDPDARFGLAGSVARGTVGNPNKVDEHGRELFGTPFNTEKYDLDLFIISDKIKDDLRGRAEKVIRAAGVRTHLTSKFPNTFMGLKPGGAGLSIKVYGSRDRIDPDAIFFGEEE